MTALRQQPDPLLFRDVFNASPVGIAIETLDGQPIFVNPAFCSMLAFSEEELLGKHRVDFSPPEDAEKDWALFQQLRAGSIDHYQMEKRYFRRDGSLVWGRLSVSLLKGGASPLVIAMIEDITEKRAAVDREHALLEMMSSITKQMAAAVSRCSRDFRYQWVNQAYADWIQRPVNEVLDHPIREVLGKEAFDSLLPHFQRVLKGETVQYEQETNFPGIGRRWTSATYTPTFDAEGATDGWVAVVHDVTDRKRAEQAIHESEQRFRLVADTAPVLIWMSGTDKLCTYFNKPWLDFTGRSIEQEFGNGWAEGVHPDDLQRCLNTYRQSFDRREKFTMEYRLRHRDGEHRWVLDVGVPRFNEDGSFAGYIGIGVDVTEHKLAEQAAFRHTAIVESSEDAIASGTVDGIIVSWNAGAERMYGYTEAEAVGKSIAILLPPERPDEEYRILETLKSGQCIKNFETVRVSKTGKRINVSLSISPIKDSSGKVAGLSGIARDISDRKRDEEKLREYQKAVESAEDMIVVIDREYRFLLANRQYLKMHNLTREQVVGHLIPEVLNKELFETLIKPKLDECFQGEAVRYERTVSYPEAGERHLMISYFPIEGANRTIDRAACILRDVTERKQAEEAMREMNRALERRSALLQSQDELLRIFVKNVPAAVAMLDHDMRYLQVSDRWCGDNSVEASELLGRSREDIPEMPERWKELNRRALKGETLRAEEDRWESRGITRWNRWEVRPWKTPDGIIGGILIFAEDITQRKQAEEALSTLSRTLIEAQEQERTRIGRELHDDINQRLAMLALELEQLQANPSEVQMRLPELRNRTTELSNDVQALSHELHSSKLEYLGVVSGIKSWCKEFGERQRMEIDFKSDVSSVLPPEVGVCLFRVLQESLHNAAKHSAVKRVEVQLQEVPNEIHLIASDLGKGFDVEAALQGQGLGLTSMQERVRLLNGSIEIQSRPMGGTTIRARVPLRSERNSHRAAG